MFNEWYLARDDSSSRIAAYPTELTGIKRYKGDEFCNFYVYVPTLDLMYGNKGIDATQWGMILNARHCKAKFGHCPKKGELLYVRKTRKGWKSEKVELEFSK